MRYIISGMFLAAVALATTSLSAEEKLKLEVSGIGKNGAIADIHAYCIATAGNKSAPEGKNISPAISWQKGPEGTKSYALLMVDTEVPTDFSDAGKEGRIISEKMPRQIFYHWVLVNIPAETTALEAGAFSTDGTAPPLGRHGVNDYPKFMGMALDERALLKHQNYDGPCPPWNDEKLHRYHYRIYALDVAELELKEPFSGADVFSAINGHVLAEGEVVGTYTLNSKINF